MKVDKQKEIRDTFLDYQKMYQNKGMDLYTATQMAASATRLDYRLSKGELKGILGYEE